MPVVYQNFAACMDHVDRAESLTAWRRSPGVTAALRNLASRQAVIDGLVERSQVPPPSLRDGTVALFAAWGSDVAGAAHAIPVVTRLLGDFEREVIAAMRAQHDPIRDALASAIGTTRQGVYDQCDLIESRHHTHIVGATCGDYEPSQIAMFGDAAELSTRVGHLMQLAALGQHYGFTVKPGYQYPSGTSRKFPGLDPWLASLQVRAIEVFSHPTLTRDDYEPNTRVPWQSRADNELWRNGHARARTAA